VSGVVDGLCQPQPLGLGSAPGSGAGDRALAITNFRRMETVKRVAATAPQPSRRNDCSPGTWAIESIAPTSCALLRRYAVGECVGVEIGVVTQTRPWAVLLRCVCDAVFLPFGKIVPRIVSSNGEEGPISAFQVLHQNISSSGVGCRAWQFTKHFFQLLPMTWSRAIIGDRINRVIITQLGTSRCGDALKNNKYKVARNIMTAGLFILQKLFN